VRVDAGVHMRPLVFVILFASGCATTEKNTIQPPTDVSPLEKKLGDNPNDAVVNLQFGNDAEASGDLLRAEQYYLRAEALGTPQDQILPRLMRVLVASHRYAEALARSQRRLAEKPGDRTTRYVQAALLVALDRPKDAERELNALVHTEPKDPEAYLQLGRLFHESDRPRALALYRKYLELAPNGHDAAAVRFELAEEPSLDVPPTEVKP
jgi:predicted Zn-dependent protease